MGKNSSIYRVVEILKLLNDGKLLCVENLASTYDTSTRSIRRDFELIKEVCGDVLISPQKGCYQAVQKFILNETLNATELYMLKNILKLSDKSNLSLAKTVDEKTKKSLLKEDKTSPYLFKTKPYEEIYAHQEKFHFLETAINSRKEINFLYKNQEKINRFTIRPYKIVFISENFYLCGALKEQKMSLLRIALMEELSFTGEVFKHELEMMDFIHFMQSPWATYGENFKNQLQEVIIQIPKNQAKYFKLKKFLPTQKIINEDEDGRLTISYQVTSQNEVISLIKQWIPYVKVLAPKGLVDVMRGVAEKYMASFE